MLQGGSEAFNPELGGPCLLSRRAAVDTILSQVSLVVQQGVALAEPDSHRLRGTGLSSG